MIPTVKIHANSERGWRIINAASFDQNLHRIFGVEVDPDPEHPVKVKLKPGRKPKPRPEAGGDGE